MKFKLTKIVFLTLLLLNLVIGSLWPASGQEGHHNIGYGLHIDPNIPVDPAVVDRLGMDWVKLYSEHQIPMFRHKRILFRQDLAFIWNEGEFKRWMSDRAASLWNQGVIAMEVHNEPNLSIEWQNKQPDAAEFTQFLKWSYEAIKTVAPDMIVVSGGLAPTVTTPDRMAITDIDYAREMFQNGAGRYFDAFGYHPYGYNAPPEDAPDYGVLNFRRAELIRKLMSQYGINKQIWMTEFGWLRNPAEDGVACSDSDPAFAGFAWLRVDGQTQADYIVRAYDYAYRHWQWSGPLFLWNLNFSQRPNDGSLPACSHMRWFGLLKSDGHPTIAFNSVAAMPKHYPSYLPIGSNSTIVPGVVTTTEKPPSMTLYADSLAVEVGSFCGGEYSVGTFVVANTGGGDFVASIKPSQAPLGPYVRVVPETATGGQEVEVFADTRGMQAGLYIIYINIRTEIEGDLVAQNMRGFVIIKDDSTLCAGR